MDKDKKDNIFKDGDNGRFSDVSFFKFVFLKCSKLSQAVYAVTSFISDKEPLKWRLREAVLDLVSDTELLVPSRYLTDGLEHEGELSPLFGATVLEAVRHKIGKTISLLDLALAGGFVSEMNAAILQREFSLLDSRLREKTGRRELEKIFGAVDVLPPVQETHQLENIQKDRNINILDNELSDRLKDRASLPLGRKETDKVSSGQNDKLSDSVSLVKKDLKKTSRRQEIIDFLKGRDWTSIKDISDAIKGCSTKTIQRELSDLVQTGVLKKKGDRRWSRYLLS